MANVLFVLNFSSAVEGSFIRSIRVLGEQIKKEGGRAIFILPERSKKSDWINSLRTDSAPVFYFYEKKSKIFKNVKFISNVIDTYGIDIIHSHFATPWQIFMIALAKRRKKNVEYIVHLNSEPKDKIALAQRTAEIIADPTLYIAVSESIKNKAFMHGKKVQTVVNAVDFSRLEFVDTTVKKEDYLSDGCRKTLFMFGQDFENKGVDFAVKTLLEKDKEHFIQLLVAAGDNAEETEKKIIQLCGEMPEWIKLLEPRNDIATYFSLADVFLNANRAEGSPYTMIECAYLGIPIIYCDIPGSSELNIPWSVKITPDSPDELYEAICEIVREDENETKLMAVDSREYVTKHFSLGTWVYEHLEIYRKIHSI